MATLLYVGNTHATIVSENVDVSVSNGWNFSQVQHITINNHVNNAYTYGEYRLTSTKVDVSDYPKCKLAYNLKKGSASLKVYYKKEGAETEYNYSFNLTSGEQNTTFTFSSIDGIKSIIKIHVQTLSDKEECEADIEDFYLIDSSDNEIFVGDRAEAWSLTVSNIANTGKWWAKTSDSALNLAKAEWTTGQKHIYTITFSTPPNTQLYVQGSSTLATIPANSTDAEFTVEGSLDNIYLKNSAANSFFGIASIKRTVLTTTEKATDAYTITEQAMGNWAGKSNLSKYDIVLRTGDIIRVTTTATTTDGYISLQPNGGGNEFLGKSISADGTYDFYVSPYMLNKFITAGSGLCLTGKNYTLSGLSIVTTDNSVLKIDVKSLGYATCYFNVPVDFTSSGAKAYVVAYKAGGTTSIELTEAKKIPANTGVIVEADEGSYTVSAIEPAAAESISSILTVATSKHTAVDGDFALGNSNGAGFYKVKSGTYIPKGKAYLHQGTCAREFYLFNDGNETTGIDNILESSASQDKIIYYNLSGQRVANPTKGLYIVNGKKILVK